MVGVITGRETVDGIESTGYEVTRVVTGQLVTLVPQSVTSTVAAW